MTLWVITRSDLWAVDMSRLVAVGGTVRIPAPARAEAGWWSVRSSVGVGVDGSGAARRAFEWAVSFAAALGVELVVAGRPRVRVPTAVRWVGGEAEAVARSECGTLVVGPRGEPLHARHLGAVVDGCASRGLVVVRGLPEAARGEHGVVTAAVGGAADSGVLLAAAEVGRARRARVRLLHVPPSFGGAAEPSRADDTPLRRAVAFLKAVAPDLAPTVVLDHRQPHEAVAASVSDLLVVGRAAGGGAGRIGKAALYHSSCPVLIPPR
ncbi:hypothetical protein SUDANB95_02808 [Actinosynnema sp. ALI-1.44]